MEREQLAALLQKVHDQQLSPQEALTELARQSYSDLGFAKIDHDRERRQGTPEVILAEGKTPEQIHAILEAHLRVHSRLLVTRLSAEKYQFLLEKGSPGRYNPQARTLTIETSPVDLRGDILIVAAGTSDLPVAEEALETALWMGNRAELLIDVGVAGLHRLLDRLERLRRARVIIVVAGMEGALMSVIKGLVAVPVIGVPTSIGYGAHFQGLAALLTMLNSCAPGGGVVNIDNGFGAAYLASLINQPSQEPS